MGGPTRIERWGDSGVCSAGVEDVGLESLQRTPPPFPESDVPPETVVEPYTETRQGREETRSPSYRQFDLGT